MDSMNVTHSLCVNESHILNNFNLSLCETSVSTVASGNETREVPSYYLSSQITTTCFLVMILLFGVSGNIIVILVICFTRKMKTALNVYLINLCIADLLVLSVCMPTVLVDIYAKDVWYFGKAMCLLVPFLENTVVHVSVLTLIAISVERYLFTCHSQTGVNDNLGKSLKVVVSIWLVCGACNIPWFIIAVYKYSKHLDGSPIKVCRLPMLLPWHKAYVTTLCSLFFAIPLFILLVLYCRICYLLYITKSLGKCVTADDSGTCYHSRSLRWQMINIMVCLVAVFFVFHLPYRVVSMWLTFADKYYIHKLGIHTHFNIVYSVRILFYFNHAINPIMYNFVSRKFRTALTRLIKRSSGVQTSMSSKKCNKAYHNIPPVRSEPGFVLFVAKNFTNTGPGKRLKLQTSSSSSREDTCESFPLNVKIVINRDALNSTVEYKHGKYSD